MPSLPVDNESLSSKEDAYRRYFGAFKKSSPPRPRRLLCFATIKICAIAILGSIPSFILFWIYVDHKEDWYNNQWEYAYPAYKAIVTFVLCLSVIVVIFKHKYAKFKMMAFNAALISGISCFISYMLQDYCRGGRNSAWDDLFTTCFLDEFWFYTIHLPLTLYFSIFVMYYGLYRWCSNPCLAAITSSAKQAFQHNQEFKQDLIRVDNSLNFNEQPEVIEIPESHTTGSVYQDEEIELSLSSRVRVSTGMDNIDDDDEQKGGYEVEQDDNISTFTFQELEQSARTSILYVFLQLMNV